MEFILHQHAALGTSWWVEGNLSPHHKHTEIHDALVAHLKNFERRYSRFCSDSLICRLNHERILMAPDAELQAILTFGQSLYTRTIGTFNFLLGDVLTDRGYGQPRTGSHTHETNNEQLPNPSTDIIITTEKITVHQGSVDLGGFGKGYVIDELAALLQNHGVTDFLINGGGDLYGTSDHGTPLTVYLEHPTMPDTYLGRVELHHQGFAASSPYRRVWKQGGIEHTHIVGITEFATYVVAKSAAIADAFATAALLLPEEDLMMCAQADLDGFARYEPRTSMLTQHQLSLDIL